MTGVRSFPQTFIDMEGSGFSGDLESLRVSVPQPGVSVTSGPEGIGGQGGVMWREEGCPLAGAVCMTVHFSVSRAQEVSLAPPGPPASQAFPESQADSG